MLEWFTKLRNSSFYFVEKTKTAAKCPKIKNTRAKHTTPLFSRLNCKFESFLFSLLLLVSCPTCSYPLIQCLFVYMFLRFLQQTMYSWMNIAPMPSWRTSDRQKTFGWANTHIKAVEVLSYNTLFPVCICRAADRVWNRLHVQPLLKVKFPP